MITGALITFPPRFIFTPTAWVPVESRTISETSARTNAAPPALRMVGRMLNAISEEPPTGKDTPLRKWFCSTACIEKGESLGMVP